MAIKVTLLGTGSPRPTLRRSQPANLLQRTGYEPLLVDAGEGTVKQLMRAGLSPDRLHTILFTHLHKDHILGYPAVVWGGWTLGREGLKVYGPPGTMRMHELLFTELFAKDIEYSFGIGFDEEGIATMEVQEISAGEPLDLNGFSIRSCETEHSFYNLAYRFDAEGKTVVLTGDTKYSPKVVDLARGADLFICDVTRAPSPDYEGERGQRILRLLEKDHCDPEQAGRMAREAEVGHLVITHMIPGARTQVIAERCAGEFNGVITVGEDLMSFVL